MSQEYGNMNLFDFIRLCYKVLCRFFRWLFMVFLYTIRLCFNYWYVMLICFAFGVSAAYFWSQPRFSRFTGKATVVFPEGMKVTVEEGMKVFLSANYETKEKLGVCPEILRGLKVFDMYNNIDARNDNTVDYIDTKRSVNHTDSIEYISSDRFTISAKVLGYSDFSSLQNALSKFFESQEIYTQPAENWRNHVRERIIFLNAEIEHMQNTEPRLEMAYNVPMIPFDNSHIMPSMPLTTEERLQSLIRERQHCETQLQATPNVINFQTPFYTETMQRRDKFIIGAVFGIVLGILVSLMVKYWKNIKSFLFSKQ